MQGVPMERIDSDPQEEGTVISKILIFITN
jgi:hypothetical protein